MGGACGTHGRDEKCCYVLVGKPEGKRPLGRPRCRGKVKLSLYLTKHHTMKMYLLFKNPTMMTYWGSGGITAHILNLGTTHSYKGVTYFEGNFLITKN
jgi:hypothetical protein